MIYKFPVKNFRASEGYVSIQVTNGKLELKEKPDKNTLALIEKHNGKEAKLKVKVQVVNKHKAVK